MAFVNVFMSYFHVVSQGNTTGNVGGARPSARKTVISGQNMDADFMEVDPPIRITEPIVLDDDDTPAVSNIFENGEEKALASTDSGIVNPASSSIEILAGPNSSQQSVQHLPNGQSSQSSIANGEDAAAKARDPTLIKNDAVTYAKQVEEALFDELREYSREKTCWQAGAAYK